MSNDFYDTLGVNKNSSQEEIKKAYRKKAMEYHPDRNKGDKSAEKKFKEIGEAYATLGDEKKKVLMKKLNMLFFITKKINEYLVKGIL